MPTRYIGDGYWEIASRQMSIVDRKQQEKFKQAKITVIGCGGIGGECIEMLARMGVGELVLVDEDAFDLSNLNRQSLATLESLGISKSTTAKEKVRIINPYVEVTAYNEHVSKDNIEKIIDDSDIVIDALDNVLARVIVSRCAKKKNIPFIHGAIHATQGQVSVFLPDSKSYEEMFNLPSKDKPLDDGTIESLKVTSILYGSSYTIGKGQKFAQLVLSEVPKAVLYEVEKVGEIGEDRGGGFGSTGKF
jgi:molybdopterin/thiamine biosynthesis adenylyltransferase